ncbi:MAG: DUF4388 domain-containing protein [Planctomycetota bacterium]|nr:DUF4388 domain-containing protein [Planctomycetota bacterium]
MGFKGDLTTFNLANIFQTLSMNRQTGTLSIFNEEEASEANVYFQEGTIRQVSTSDSRKLRLGEVLLRMRLISAEELEQALATQRTTREKLGDILVRSGFISEEKITDALRFQQEETIYELFTWDGALFEFIDDHMPEDAFSKEVFDLGITLNPTR